MTGDGVNDALALKDADIGVAMGNGAQATKAVAQLVLLDGRFSHLPSVLAEGRRVIGNVERVANLFVAKNVMSLIAIISAALFTLPFPFLPRHLTLVSAVTIGIPAFFLALGPNKRRYIPGFLRRVLRFAVPAGVVAGLVVLVSYLLARNAVGAPPASECLVRTESSSVDRQRHLLAAVVRGDDRPAGHLVLDSGGAVPAVPAVEGMLLVGSMVGHRRARLRDPDRPELLQLLADSDHPVAVARGGRRRRGRHRGDLPDRTWHAGRDRGLGPASRCP